MGCLIIDLNDFLASISSAHIGHSHCYIQVGFPILINQLGFFRLNLKFRIGQSVTELKLDFIRAEGLKIPVPDINILLIKVLKLISIVTGGRIIIDGVCNRIR
ncbi:hypothetical protein D3C81_1272010 [compost metagenome]